MNNNFPFRDNEIEAFLQHILNTVVADYEPLEKHEDGTYTDKKGNEVEFRGASHIMIKNGEPAGEKGEAMIARNRRKDEGYSTYTSDDVRNGKIPEYLKKAFADKKCDALPDSATNIRIADSVDTNVWVRYKQPSGGTGTIQNPAFKEEQAKKKFKLVAFLRQTENISKIDNTIDTLLKDKKTKGLGTVLLTMRLMGTRIGKVGNTTNLLVKNEDGTPKLDKDGKKVKVKVPTYGASTLLGKHISVEPDGVWLRFLGKDGQDQNHLVTNKRLASLLVAAKKAAGDDKRIFNVSENQTNKVLAKLSDEMGWTGDRQMHNHNLRHIKANEVAEKEIAKYIKENHGLPASEKEYAKAVREVCKVVSSVLGNKPAQAKESYIDPNVWKRLQRKGVKYDD